MEEQQDLKDLAAAYGKAKRYLLYSLIPSGLLAAASAAWTGHKTIADLTVRTDTAEAKIKQLSEDQKDSILRIEKKIDKIYDHLLR